MAIFRNKAKDTLAKLLIFSLFIFSFYTGWPQLWSKLPFPPKVQKVKATTLDYTTAGNTETFEVPTGVTSITVKVWGAGGGGGGGGNNIGGGAGAGGGFVQDTISVSAGQTLTITVGSGGGPGLTSSCGLDGSSDDGGGGAGGGYSAVTRSGTILIQAGGGGGGGAGSAGGETGGAGGGGGTHTTSGVNGVQASGSGGAGGGGGTSSGGGTKGSGGAGGGTDGADGSANQGGAGGDVSTTACGGNGSFGNGGNGGDASTTNGAGGGGGGGGGGRYGAGGGEAGASEGAGGGGGGSGLCSDGACVSETAGNGTTEGGSADSNHNSARGAGGGGGAKDANGSAGEAGQVVIIYNTASSFSVNPTDTPDPVDVGNSVIFAGTATDSESDSWYLAVCTTGAVTAGTPPTCDVGTYCVSSSAVASGSENTCSWTSTGADAQDWYAFACDNSSLQAICSTANTTNSPITVNTASGAFDVTASSSQSFNASLEVSFTVQTSTMTSIGAIQIVDDRGTSAGWTVNLTGNDWKTDTSLVQMDYDGNGSDDNTGKLCPFPADANLYAEVGNLTGMSKGSNDCFGSGLTTIDLVTATNGNGNGTYWLTDMALEQLIPGNPTAAVYTTTIVFTLQ